MISLMKTDPDSTSNPSGKPLEANSNLMAICLLELKMTLESNGFIHVPGKLYRSILLHYGALEGDLESASRGEFHDIVGRDTEDAMSFRQIAFHRMLWNQNTPSSSIFAANQASVTQISKDEICSEKGANVYFERSGTRTWNLPPQSFAASSIPRAIARFNAFMEPSAHHFQSNLNTDDDITINDIILIRVNKFGSQHPRILTDPGVVQAEPTPEGIHQDGTEISSVTMIQCHNTSGCDSRLWKLNQPTGNYHSSQYGELDGESTDDSFSWDNCLLNKSLSDPWETIVFNDRIVKHEARKFLPLIDDEEHNICHRDVIVNFVRKPLLDGSDGLDENSESFARHLMG